MKKFLISIGLVLAVIVAGIGSYFISYFMNKPPEPEPPKEKIFKIYYLDEASNEKSKLTYYTKKIDTTTDITTQTNELISILKRGHDNGYSPFPAYADVNSVELVENTLKVDLNDNFFVLQSDSYKLKDIAIDCVVNTLIQINGIHNVEIIRNGEKVEKFGSRNLQEYLKDNIESYEVISHSEDKLASYLIKIPYKNKNKKQVFESLPTTWAAKEVTVKNESTTPTESIITYLVEGKSTVRTPAMPKSYEEVYKITEEGLFIDDVKFLSKNLYVGNTWEVENFKPLLNSTGKTGTYKATFKVIDVVCKEEKENFIKEYEIEITVPDLVTKTSATYVENLTFREGQGIYKRNIIDPTSTIHTRLDVNVLED